MPAGVPWSLDLRVLAVEAYNNGEGTLKEVAEQFRIGRRTLSELIRRERETGTLEAKENRGRPPRRVDEAGLVRLNRIVESRPDATLDEIRDAYNADPESAAAISRQTVGREVARLGLTRKKKR
jgi:putative transposase